MDKSTVKKCYPTDLFCNPCNDTISEPRFEWIIVPTIGCTCSYYYGLQLKKILAFYNMIISEDKDLYC